jgi:hypothetical protein
MMSLQVVLSALQEDVPPLASLVGTGQRGQLLEPASELI